MFREDKATAIATYFVQQGRSEEINDLDLMKLMYFAEREALSTAGKSLTDDDFFSLPKGPILSRTYDCMKHKGQQGIWIQHFNILQKYAIRMVTPYDWPALLAEWEVDILQQIWQRYGHLSKWGKVSIAHNPDLYPEWQKPSDGQKRIPISLERIFELGLKLRPEIALARAENIRNAQSLDSWFAQ